MKTTRYLFYCSILALYACEDRSKKSAMDSSELTTVDTLTLKSNSFTPYRLNESYMVVDTGCFDAMVYSGQYAVIKRNGYPADTIDLGVGMQKIGHNSYFFASVTDTAPPDDETSGNTDCKKIIKGDIGNYFVIKNGAKQKLNTLVSDFSDYFSSPWVLNGKIYFWQIKTINRDSASVVSAAEYNPATKTLNTHFIKNDFIETDDPGYFTSPFLKNDTIYFYFGENESKKFSADFKPYN
jgi:hypothetical protein